MTLDDSGLGEGFEFVSPMLDLKEVPFYFKTVSQAISDIGYSNNGSGLHFHISSPKLKDIDMAKFMTFLNSHEGLLAEYHNRNEYVASLSDIFKKSDIKKFNEDILNQSKHYDIVFLDGNHIELRAFGGADIYNRCDEVLNQLNTILNTYRIGCEPKLEVDLYKELIEDSLNQGNHQDKTEENIFSSFYSQGI